jgi:hemerythrin-like domain-containing protein
MDALKVLKQDHETVKRLFAEYEAAGDGNAAGKGEISKKIFRELELHSRVEEEIFYPALTAKGGTKGKELVEESLDEHAAVDELIQELRTLEPDDSEYDEKFQELMESVEHHIEEEESEMFPEAQRKLGAELDELGREIEEEKASALL